MGLGQSEGDRNVSGGLNGCKGKVIPPFSLPTCYADKACPGRRARRFFGGSMYTQNIGAVLIVAIAASLSLPPSRTAGQTASANTAATAIPAPKKKTPSQPKAANTSRPPTQVEVRRRSFLDPGTETRAREEHDLDYAFPLTESASGNDQFLHDYRITNTRSPFPSCLDLAGFC